MFSSAFILITLFLLSTSGCRESVAKDITAVAPPAPTPQVAAPVMEELPPEPEKPQIFTVTPEGLSGLFQLSDSLSMIGASLGLTEPQPLTIDGRGGRSFLNTHPQYAERFQIMLRMRAEEKAWLICTNPNYRMAGGRGVGSPVGDFLTDFRLENKGGVESVDGLKDKPGMYAVYWLLPRENPQVKSRFGLVLQKQMTPMAFLDENEIEKWAQADEETLRDEKVMGFIYLLEVEPTKSGQDG